MDFVNKYEEYEAADGGMLTSTLYSMFSTFDAHYHVEMIETITETFDKLLSQLVSGNAVIFISPSIDSLFGEILREKIAASQQNYAVHTLYLTESNKSLNAVQRVCEIAQSCNIDRHGVLVAIGGGVISDVVTLAASLVRRGVSYIKVPTTLVGQIDAGIGVKGAINFNARKSFLGCFHPPASVMICPAFLATLDSQYIKCGLAEIIKMAVVSDSNLFTLIERHQGVLKESSFQQPSFERTQIINLAVTRMLEALEPNLYENKSLMRTVDFGHTFSQLVESQSQYSIQHGEAVAIDIALSTAISYQLGMLSGCSASRIIQLLLDVGLPVWHASLSVFTCNSSMEEASLHRGGSLNLVVPTDIGSADFIADTTVVSEEILELALLQIKNVAACQQSEHQVRQLGNHKYNYSQRPVKHLVIDVGGTSIRVAHYNAASNSISELSTIATPNYLMYEDESIDGLVDLFLDTLDEAIKASIVDFKLIKISLGFAGPIRSDGLVLAAPTIWGSKMSGPIDLASRVQMRWPDVAIHLINDVAAAGYRFLRHPLDNMVVITVGSGIGNKTFLSGRPVTGDHGWGGEIGHIQVDKAPSAPMCDCGRRGHLGAVSSGRGALNMALLLEKEDPAGFSSSSIGKDCHGNIDNINNELIVMAFRRGDAWVTDLIDRVAEPLAVVIATIHMNLGIGRFVIFGGFALALGEQYRRRLSHFASKSCWDVGQSWDDMIILGASDPDSGLIGAGRSCYISRDEPQAIE